MLACSAGQPSPRADACQPARGGSQVAIEQASKQAGATWPACCTSPLSLTPMPPPMRITDCRPSQLWWPGASGAAGRLFRGCLERNAGCAEMALPPGRESTCSRMVAASCSQLLRAAAAAAGGHLRRARREAAGAAGAPSAPAVQCRGSSTRTCSGSVAFEQGRCHSVPVAGQQGLPAEPGAERPHGRGCPHREGTICNMDHA